MKNWIDFYDSAHSIYVNAAHRKVHYRLLAEAIAAYVPSSDAVVIDYSCGEALSSALVAERCGTLVLAEPGPTVRARLIARFQDNPKIEVCSPEDLAQRPRHSADLVIMNSVVQYITPDELDTVFDGIQSLLRPGGRLVVGDVLDPRVGAISDAATLLRFARKHGFLKDAIIGLVRTVLSDYRRLRRQLGINRYNEEEMLAKLRTAGFVAVRAPENLGHDRNRMAFVATVAG